MTRPTTTLIPVRKAWMTSTQVAAVFGVSRETIRRWATAPAGEKPRLPPHHHTHGGHLRFDPDDIIARLNSDELTDNPTDRKDHS